MMVRELSIAEVFRLAAGNDPADILNRLSAWGRLQRLGFAEQYAVGGRFLHLSLTEAGKIARDAAMREQTS